MAPKHVARRRATGASRRVIKRLAAAGPGRNLVSPVAKTLKCLVCLGCPQPFLQIVYLLMTNSALDTTCIVGLLELCAGAGNCGKAFAKNDVICRSMDIKYDAVRDNILGDVGYANTVVNALQLAPGSMAIMGPVCSSWVFMNRGTSARARWQPLGNEELESASSANVMVARLVLVILILEIKNVWWVLEQPASSLMQHHGKFKWLCDTIDVWRQFVYMGSFGARSKKPSYLLLQPRRGWASWQRPPAREPEQRGHHQVL